MAKKLHYVEIGEKYNHLTALEIQLIKKTNKNDKIHSYTTVKCECDCEDKTIIYVEPCKLVTLKRKSCGCANKNKVRIGEKYNFLTVIDLITKPYTDKYRTWNKTYARCKCDCGNESYDVEPKLIENNLVKSCGCKNDINKYKVKIGDVFGNLTVIGKQYKNGPKTVLVPCKCKCGKTHEAKRNKLCSGKIYCCGVCYSEELKNATKIGEKYFYLTVTSNSYQKLLLTKNKENYNQFYVTCNCDCGKKNVEVRVADLIYHRRQSCSTKCWWMIGYKNPISNSISDKEVAKSVSKIYKSWMAMKARCNPKNKEKFPHHAGKGIKICNEWLVFENFRNWALSNGYKYGLTNHRINSEKDYAPNNCVLLTKSEHKKAEIRDRDIRITQPLKIEIQKLKNELEIYKQRFGVIENIE